MAQSNPFLLFALVAFNFHSLVITAAPVRDSVAFLPADDSAPAATPTQPETTVTDWATITVIEQPMAPTATPSGNRPPPQSWTLPEMFTDLSPMAINKLAYGSKNIEIVSGIPASATAASPNDPASATPASVSSTQLPRPWTNSSSAYRILYPAGSINPGNRPQGGSEFYATPGNLPFEGASNVTLEYSIFFPADFEWVQGGKLPGIYGGHAGCSGGNSATSCFSTRLMWRKGGAGELYLYAPKDKQTTALCHAPPQSICDADYGLSVGRGSFHFAAGGWTHVSQTVRLNTPGKQDGGFELVVNGQRVIRRDDVFYRDVPQAPDQGGEDPSRGGGNDVPFPFGLLRREMQSNLNVGFDILPPLLPLTSKVEDILGGAVSDQESPFFAPSPAAFEAPSPMVTRTPTNAPTTVHTTALTYTTSTQSSMTSSAFAAEATHARVLTQTTDDGAVGFSGLFFSTFFGGHEQSWASPKDQHTWFKDFGMSINE